MNIDRWQTIVDQIKTHFPVEDEGSLESEEHGGTITEYIIFKGSLGKMKLEFISKPRIIDKKMSYSNRIGSDVAIEYIYSPTEKTHQFLPYRWIESSEQWAPIDANDFNLG